MLLNHIHLYLSKTVTLQLFAIIHNHNTMLVCKSLVRFINKEQIHLLQWETLFEVVVIWYDLTKKVFKSIFRVIYNWTRARLNCNIFILIPHINKFINIFIYAHTCNGKIQNEIIIIFKQLYETTSLEQFGM